MIFFLYGEDSYRSKKKLQEIIEGYRNVHKSGMSLIYFDAKEKGFADFLNSFRSASIFDDKKMTILKNSFLDIKFQESFLENIDKLEKAEDIIVIYEAAKVDQRTKLFKALQKRAKCQEFDFLSGAALKKWAVQEFEKRGGKILPQALDYFLNYIGGDLWQVENEIKKLCDFKNGKEITKDDIELQVRSKTENDIFKTIEALSAKDKKQALILLKKHLDSGDNVLYILSMVAYQFKNLLILRDLIDKKVSYGLVAKRSGLHPFVVQKTIGMANRFSMEQLRQLYQKIFETDFDIKTGRVDPEIALEIFIAKI